MAYATPAGSPLRRRMIDDMTLRNLSPATQRSYLHAVAKFSRYCDRSPDRLRLEDVRGSCQSNSACGGAGGWVAFRMTKPNPFKYFKTSPEIIRLAVMMYVRFPLSLRNVEDLLHERDQKYRYNA
jgi:hypothetical protein